MEKKLYYRAIPKINGEFYIIEEKLKGRGKNCFLTKEESVEHFTKARVTALEKYEKITAGINKIKEEVGDFHFDYEIEALDDTGVCIEMYMKFDVDGYSFMFN